MVISTFEFTRDANGNITRSLREDGSCWYYAYDGLQRLTGADWKDAGGVSLYAFEYAYDKVGNRLRFGQNGVSTYYSYNAANELTVEVTPGVETAYYTYDGRGNQTARQVLGGHTLYFEYNSRNLIAAITSDDPAFTTNTFTYNALGQRITKTDSTGFTRYIWDGLHILLELDASGNVTRRYTHGTSPIEGVSSLISVQDELGCPCFYHFDQVGGVRQLTDRWQNPIKAYAYEPFGRILAEDGNAPNEYTLPAPYLRLPDLPMFSLSQTRMYSGRYGRFAQRDPLDKATHKDSYIFVHSAPLTLADAGGFASTREQAREKCLKSKAELVKLCAGEKGKGLALELFYKCAAKKGNVPEDPEKAIRCLHPDDDRSKGLASDTVASYDSNAKLLYLNVTFWEKDANVNWWGSAVHELVHAVDRGTQFSADFCEDRMIREARAYWREGGCSCEDACKRAWESSAEPCVRNVFLEAIRKDIELAEKGKEPVHGKALPRPDEWVKQNKDRYITRCQEMCNKKGPLENDRLVDEACKKVLGWK